jgi:hypothetical protein
LPCLAKPLLGLLHGLPCLGRGRLRLAEPLLCPGEVAPGLVGILLRPAEVRLNVLRGGLCVAKPAPRLFETLALLALAFAGLRSSLARRDALLRPACRRRRPPLRRLPPGERREQLEAGGFEVSGEPAAGEQLSALVGGRGRLERRHDPVEGGFAASARVVEDAGCRSAQTGQRVALGLSGLVEASLILAGQETLLSFAQPVGGVEQEVDLSPLLSSELVDGPGREGRLAEILDELRFLALAGVAELAAEPVTLGDEPLGLDRVEAVERLLDVVYAPDLRRRRSAWPRARDDARPRPRGPSAVSS